MSDFVFKSPAAPKRTAIALLSLSGMACVALGVLYWASAVSRGLEIADLQSLVLKSQQMSGAVSDPAADGRFYEGDTPQLAQTQMQSDMQALADKHKLKIDVIRAAQIQPDAKRIVLGLTLSGVIPEAALGAFLTDLSQHQPMLVVVAINLRRARGGRQAGAVRMLSIQLKLSGFVAR